MPKPSFTDAIAGLSLFAAILEYPILHAVTHKSEGPLIVPAYSLLVLILWGTLSLVLFLQMIQYRSFRPSSVTRFHIVSWVASPIIGLSSLFFLWGKPQVVIIHSLDRSQCVSVITQDTCRYIVNGEHESVPDSGYAKLDIRNVSYTDCIHICWRNADHEWEVIVDGSRIIVSRLDSSRYKLSTSLPRDERGIPTEIRFRQPGCAIFSYYGMKLSPNQGAIVEIR
jgi:hypothetical protein